MTEEQFRDGIDSFQERCDLKMQHLSNSIGDLKNALFGNGKEGVTTRMTRMEIAVGELVEQRREMRKLIWGIVASVIIVILTTMMSQAFSYVRQQEVLTQTVQSVNEIRDEIAVINE